MEVVISDGGCGNDGGFYASNQGEVLLVIGDSERNKKREGGRERRKGERTKKKRADVLCVSILFIMCVCTCGVYVLVCKNVSAQKSFLRSFLLSFLPYLLHIVLPPFI